MLIELKKEKKNILWQRYKPNYVLSVEYGIVKKKKIAHAYQIILTRDAWLVGKESIEFRCMLIKECPLIFDGRRLSFQLVCTSLVYHIHQSMVHKKCICDISTTG